MTLSGIEPAAFRRVVLCLTQLRYRVLPEFISNVTKEQKNILQNRQLTHVATHRLLDRFDMIAFFVPCLKMGPRPLMVCLHEMPNHVNQIHVQCSNVCCCTVSAAVTFICFPSHKTFHGSLIQKVQGSIYIECYYVFY
jgi:hypothetical protein